jgi:hypothetical protein
VVAAAAGSESRRSPLGSACNQALYAAMLRPNFVEGAGQPLVLPGARGRARLDAAHDGNVDTTATILSADAGTESVLLRLTDWACGAAYGNAKAIPMACRIRAGQGQDGPPVAIFGTTLPLDPTKTVRCGSSCRATRAWRSMRSRSNRDERDPRAHRHAVRVRRYAPGHIIGEVARGGRGPSGVPTGWRRPDDRRTRARAAVSLTPPGAGAAAGAPGAARPPAAGAPAGSDASRARPHAA